MFFIGWDLWQEMTFVLACCIVTVFGIGFIRLWLSNRTLRKLEVIDEEKRARTLEIRQCGIDTWAANDIPFGIRAIQSGIEVDGIWISRPCDHDISHVASSTTLIGEPSELGRVKGTWQDRASAAFRRSQHASGSSTIGETPSTDPLLPPESPVLVALDDVAEPPDDASTSSEQQSHHTESQVSSYIPTGSYGRQQGTSAAGTELSRFRPSRLSTIASSGAEVSDVLEQHPPMTAVSTPIGAAEVFVNRDARRSNRGFEVLPAGLLGPRQELLDSPNSESGELNANQTKERRQPNKLRKKARWTREEKPSKQISKD